MNKTFRLNLFGKNKTNVFHYLFPSVHTDLTNSVIQNIVFHCHTALFGVLAK